jgi:hypothetical protein
VLNVGDKNDKILLMTGGSLRLAVLTENRTKSTTKNV